MQGVEWRGSIKTQECPDKPRVFGRTVFSGVQKSIFIFRQSIHPRSLEDPFQNQILHGGSMRINNVVVTLGCIVTKEITSAYFRLTIIASARIHRTTEPVKSHSLNHWWEEHVKSVTENRDFLKSRYS